LKPFLSTAVIVIKSTERKAISIAKLENSDNAFSRQLTLKTNFFLNHQKGSRQQNQANAKHVHF
jgi:hypothetical protein